MQGKVRVASAALNYVSIGTLVAMMLLVTTSVFFRYVLHNPLPGDLEVVELMMVVIIMMSLAYTQAVGGHVAVKFLVDRLPPRAQARIDIFNYVVATALLGLIVWQSFERGLWSFTKGEVTVVLLLPAFWFRFLVPLGFALWTLEAIIKVRQSIGEARKKR